MAILSDGVKYQLRQAVRNPVAWWKGDGIPDGDIRPWEGGIQFLAESLKGFMGGFTNIRARLYIGLDEGKIPPKMKMISDIITITWDGLNDPMVGVYLDKKNFGERVHRLVMRFNATLSPLLILFQCFNFGLTPKQRIIQWIIVGMFADLISTTNSISESKIWAGITPHSEQRGALQRTKNVGNLVGNAVSGISTLLMGLKDILNITDYQIMIWGASLFAPLTIFCRWLPSFAKQRIDFTVRAKAESSGASGSNGGAVEENSEQKLTLREIFSIVKHNKWFLMWVVVNLIKVIAPRTDELFFYRFLLTDLRFRGKPLGGEVIYTIKNIVTGLPGLLLSPYAIQAVNKFGDKIKFLKGYALVNMFTCATTYFIGYKSPLRLIYMFLMDGLRYVFEMWAPVPRGMMDYEMYDYVEWKTGYRSEGITAAVDGFLNKLVKNNLNSVIGNAVTEWTGFLGWDVPLERQPPRFLKSIWPLMYVGVFFGEIVTLIALFWFKYPHDQKVVEADLIQRRALAKKLKEEALTDG